MVNRKTRLSTWLNVETKTRFSAAAARQGLSESALLKRLVEQMLSAAPNEANSNPSIRSEPRGARLTVRLVLDDRLLLRERAAARGMPAATYVSSLVRAHLRTLAPLPKEELAELRHSIAELSAVGRSLNQIARALSQDTRVAAPGRDEALAMIRVAEGLRDHFRALLKANIKSWQQGHAETTH
jgi:predicted DNA binding CopG/RHH family protein